MDHGRITWNPKPDSPASALYLTKRTVNVQPINLATGMALLASVLVFAFCGYDQHYQKCYALWWEPFRLILRNLLDVGNYAMYSAG